GVPKQGEDDMGEAAITVGPIHLGRFIQPHRAEEAPARGARHWLFAATYTTMAYAWRSSGAGVSPSVTEGVRGDEDASAKPPKGCRGSAARPPRLGLRGVRGRVGPAAAGRGLQPSRAFPADLRPLPVPPRRARHHPRCRRGLRPGARLHPRPGSARDVRSPRWLRTDAASRARLDLEVRGTRDASS